MLTHSNYQEWVMLMQVNMEAQGIWYAIEPEEDDIIEYRDDRLAMAAILRSVPAEMLPALRGKRTAQAAWEAVKMIRVGVQRVRESNAQQLRREFAAMGWNDGETAEDFSMRLTGLANNLRILGDNITEAEVVRKMLQVVPEDLSQVAISIETLLDLNTISVEEVTGRLRAVEQRRKPPPVVDSQGWLLLTQEEWMAKLKIGGGPGEKGSSSGGAGNKRGGGSRGRGRANSSVRQAPGAGEGTGQPKKSDKCKYCGKKGHWAKECRSRLRDEAHLAQAEEEDNEPTLLMARATLTSDPLPLRAASPPPHATSVPLPQGSASPPPHAAGKRRPLQIVEAKVFAQLDAGEDDRDESLWYLDTGATNHMSGCRTAFHDLDTQIRGVVKFGDSSVVPIEGAGTVLL